MGEHLKTKKTNLSWVCPLPITASRDPVLCSEDELLVCAVWKTGETDWQNGCTDTSSRLFSSLGFSSCGGGIEEEPANYFHLVNLKSKGKDTYPGFQSSVMLYTASDSISLLVFDLKRPKFFKNLKFKAAWSLKAPLNSHCGLEPYIMKAVMLR